MREIEDIRTLLDSGRTSNTAFQSIAITSLQILDTILEKEAHANDAALSLGQGAKVQQMINSLSDVQELLLGVLNKQGQQLLALQISLVSTQDPAPSGGSWWLCLQELIETIQLGIDCIGSIIKSQPKDSLAFMLGVGITNVLTVQHTELLAETDEQLIE